MPARCQISRCGLDPYHSGDCLIEPVPKVLPLMPLPWATAITTVMQELTGELHPACTSDALLLAVSIVMERLKNAEAAARQAELGLKVKDVAIGVMELRLKNSEDGGEWIEGLPMGTGDYLLKAFCTGSRTRRRGRLTLGYEYDWKHKPAEASE